VSPILAANNWPTNAELIADVAQLYLREDMVILDPTYGRGVWWRKWKPYNLITGHHDRGFDFTDMPFKPESFDAVTYDPPYVCIGGRKGSKMAKMHDHYGLFDAPDTPAKLQGLIDDGLEECMRVLKRGGILLVKCQDYVSSGKLWPGTHHTLHHALDLELELLDRFEHYGAPRPQPAGRRQVHARRNLSTLFVFRKP
jgi:tRNA G10  N-methylase Trm11